MAILVNATPPNISNDSVDKVRNDALKFEMFVAHERNTIIDAKVMAEMIMNGGDGILTLLNKEYPDDLPKPLLNASVILAGGFFTSHIQDQPYKDLDVFVLDYDQTRRGIQNTMLFRTGVTSTNTSHYSHYKTNGNIISTHLDPRRKINWIFTKYKTRKELIAHFDFLHCCVSFMDGRLYISHATFRAIMDKHLVMNNPKNFMKWRYDKFISRGFKADPEVKKVADLFADIPSAPSSPFITPITISFSSPFIPPVTIAMPDDSKGYHGL